MFYKFKLLPIKGLALQGDALFQMGRFEHALVIYHRGNRYATLKYLISNITLNFSAKFCHP